MALAAGTALPPADPALEEAFVWRLLSTEGALLAAVVWRPIVLGLPSKPDGVEVTEGRVRSLFTSTVVPRSLRSRSR